MNYMYLYIYFADEHIEGHYIKRFSDLSQTRSQFYYYEKPNDEWGKGTCFKREDIKCFEISPWPLENWERELEKQCTTQ